MGKSSPPRIRAACRATLWPGENGGRTARLAGRRGRAVVGTDRARRLRPCVARTVRARGEAHSCSARRRALEIEHAGSTSVPGLAAKPVIDIVLVVRDSADEAAYVPQLEAAGYVLRIREPDWFEHRLLKGPDTNVNIHVFSPGCAEVERMLLFRDWLRRNEADHDLYERAKRELAQKQWNYVQDYADAKSAVVEEILARARRSQDQGPT